MIFLYGSQGAELYQRIGIFKGRRGVRGITLQTFQRPPLSMGYWTIGPSGTTLNWAVRSKAWAAGMLSESRIRCETLLKTGKKKRG